MPSASQEQIEQRLREQLERSRREFQNASPARLPAAREQYLKDLRAFSDFILTGSVPASLRVA